MKALVTGASGFIGARLVQVLLDRGDQVVATGRDLGRLKKRLPSAVHCVAWDPMAGPPPAEALDGVDAVFNLAGETVAARWTKARRTRILESRTVGTRNLVAAIKAAERKPEVLVNASAIGIYGDRQHQVIHETSPASTDFLADVCKAWEAEAVKAPVRTCIVRIGIVLGRDGGAYPRLSRPFRLFLGGNIGQGLRWFSWIHVEDVVGILLHLATKKDTRGVFNATAPNPVSNGEFTTTLASVLRRPALFPVPPPMLKLIPGGSLALYSQRVLPMRTLAAGYAFKFPKVRGALEDLR